MRICVCCVGCALYLAELGLDFLVGNGERLLVGLQRLGLLGGACLTVRMPRARVLLRIQVQVNVHLCIENATTPSNMDLLHASSMSSAGVKRAIFTARLVPA